MNKWLIILAIIFLNWVQTTSIWESLMQCEAEAFMLSDASFFFLSFFIDIHLKISNFVSEWFPDRNVRKYSFKCEMKISKLNHVTIRFRILSGNLRSFTKSPGKKAIFSMDFGFFTIRLSYISRNTYISDRLRIICDTLQAIRDTL